MSIKELDKFPELMARNEEFLSKLIQFTKLEKEYDSSDNFTPCSFADLIISFYDRLLLNHIETITWRR